ncbi:uncharacterized protein LOC133923792 isoform X2 [Phragmites australis]|uniref:uncharacterized protein LOC133923792 isoform X2 n=1 Tax=Phragmites australis TaxID=29695 RepID=UPI002D7777C9|nr:uncharacterized protein LOC133923792 isoform X2 [Phragmites australis]
MLMLRVAQGGSEDARSGAAERTRLEGARDGAHHGEDARCDSSKQMDRSWINGRQFSKAHIDGVSDFMKFVRERFGENEEILCSYRKYLNWIHRPQGHVEDHLYIYGMASTCNRWIHHGELFDAGVHENAHHHDEYISGQEDVGFNEDEDTDDRIPDMIEEMYTAEGHSGGQTMFASVIEELKHELYPGCAGFTSFHLL